MSPGDVRLVITDIDGVLTDGTIEIDDRGGETKRFCVQDGLGVRLLQEGGVPVGFLSSRKSEVVRQRAEDLGVRICSSGVERKKLELLRMASSLAIPLEAVCYLGDDLLDLPCLGLVGFPVAVANARPEVREAAAYVTRARGGQGAFREVAELILTERGSWDRLLESYR